MRELSADELKTRYAAVLDKIEAVLPERTTILRTLIRDHRLSAVHLEGFTADVLSDFLKLVELMK